MSYDNYAIRFMFLAYQLSGSICDKQHRTCFVSFYLKIACDSSAYQQHVRKHFALEIKRQTT